MLCFHNLVASSIIQPGKSRPCFAAFRKGNHCVNDDRASACFIIFNTLVTAGGAIVDPKALFGLLDLCVSPISTGVPVIYHLHEDRCISHLILL